MAKKRCRFVDNGVVTYLIYCLRQHKSGGNGRKRTRNLACDVWTEQAFPVQVEMPAFTLTYSGELRDVIVLKELEGEDALEFNVKLSQVQAHIFTLQYNSTNGEFVTVLEDKAGEKIPVAFQMAELPEDLTEEDKNLFLTAQEAVNEIAASLVVKE